MPARRSPTTTRPISSSACMPTDRRAPRHEAPRSLRSASIASAKTRGGSRRPTERCCRCSAAAPAKSSLVEWDLAQAAHLDGSTAFAGIVEQNGFAPPQGLPSVALQRAPMRDPRRRQHAGRADRDGLPVESGRGEAADLGRLSDRIAQALTDAVVAFRDHVERRPVPSSADEGHAAARVCRVRLPSAACWPLGLVGAVRFVGPRWLTSATVPVTRRAAPGPR